jgi:hypothetical protein
MLCWHSGDTIAVQSIGFEPVMGEREMNFSEVLNRVIVLAGKVRDYYDTELPKRFPRYPLIDGNEEDVPPPPEEKELSDFLATLSDDMIYQLILIQYLGRLDFGVDDLAKQYDGLKDTVGDPADAVALMMMDKATLADELSDGLEELRKHKINVDKMPLKKVKVRKR